MNTITTADLIYERAKTLPEEQAQEVLDFLEYLQAKLKRLAATTREAPNQEEEPLPGFGMWANRQDRPSTEEYPRTTRKPRYTL